MAGRPIEQPMSVTEPVTQQLSPATDVSTAVVMAVAETTGTSPDDLPPLFDVVDPDALDTLFQARMDGQPRTGIRVTFTMAGCTVTVQDGAVAVS